MSYTLIVILSFTTLFTGSGGDRATTTQNTVIDIQNIKSQQACKREQAAINRTVALTPNVEVKFSHCTRVN